MTTMAENVIAAGADNRPPMLEKSMYNSWKIRMKLYIRGKEHGKDLLDSVLHRPFQYGTVIEDGITRPRTYEELTDKEKIHDECHIRATNIVLQGLPPDVYNIVNHHTVAKEIWDKVKLLIKGTELSLKEHECLVVPSFLPSDDLIASLNKAMTFISITISSCYPITNNRLRTSSNPRNQVTIQDGIVTMQNVQGRQSQSFAGNGSKSIATISGGNRNVGTNAANQKRVIRCYNCWGEGHMTDDLDAFDSDCDEAPSIRAVLMANLFSYDSDVISKDFNKGLHAEINEMKAVFNQMEYEFEQYSIDKKCFEI
ncbi:hypothetical protein Tco_1232633 [Tanacetum coccineum]